MKQSLIALSQSYVTALRTHLKPGAPVRLLAAQGIGRQAVALGMETLELARMHEHALVELKVSPDKTGLIRRAESFFTEANTPIEETHRPAQDGAVHLSRLKESLGERTQELAATNRQLQRGVDRRKVIEVAAEKTGQHYKKCLEESLELQKRLRLLTHRVIATQEDERKSISNELHNEIAQTLLGINVRLLSLKQEARVNHKGLKSDIAGTARLVAQSAQSVRRIAKEFGRL
jgi:signal transduction histidine kinase